MRSLSEAQAKRCERATTPRCKCRCAGRFHGAKRTGDVRELPPDDPHRPAEKKLRRPRGPVERDTQATLEDLKRKLIADDEGGFTEAVFDRVFPQVRGGTP